jgi:hypothetical protein
MNIDRFALLVAASAISHPANAQQAEIALPDRTYELSVVTADGGGFRDCATFGGDHALVLQAGRGLIVDWLPEATDPSERRFHAVTDGSRMASNPFGLAIHGAFVGTDAIRGNAVNDRGLTFTFTGRLNRACASAAVPYADGSPYAAAPVSTVLFEPAEGSVAGRLYGVRLYGADVADDCLRFVIDGTLLGNGGARLAWGMDRLNEVEGSFQAVGATEGASAGLALRGQLTSWGELRVHGIESNGAGVREIVGSGREAGACIDEQA